MESNHYLEYCGFTDFEKEVFRLKDRGWSHGEVANHLNCCEKKIVNHVKDIKRKINRCMKENPFIIRDSF